MPVPVPSAAEVARPGSDATMGTRDDRETQLPPLDMTPMIDCTFNLLIFFLCNINFRALEAKLPAYLPRDVGVNIGSVDTPPLEPIDIRVARRQPVDVRDPAWVWRFDQLDVRVQGRPVATQEALFSLLRRVIEKEPATRVVLRPKRGSLYVDCVKVIDECLRARLTDVTFVGTTEDA